jgi:hypothetical protein
VRLDTLDPSPYHLPLWERPKDEERELPAVFDQVRHQRPRGKQGNCTPSPSHRPRRCSEGHPTGKGRLGELLNRGVGHGSRHPEDG